MAKKRFEFSDDDSNEFWEIEVSGKAHTVTYGHIGTDGESKTRSFANFAAAQADAEKRIRKRTKKGYEAVNAAGDEDEDDPKVVERTRKNKKRRARADEEKRRLTPHEVLGVALAASPEEIKAAYRQLSSQYHPDKVAHLGPELQKLAQTKFVEINLAYEALRPPRNRV